MATENEQAITEIERLEAEVDQLGNENARMVTDLEEQTRMTEQARGEIARLKTESAARLELTIRRAVQRDKAQARAKALEEVAEAAEIIIDVVKAAGPYREHKSCPHGNAPVYPSHGNWCDRCFSRLETALAEGEGP